MLLTVKDVAQKLNVSQSCIYQLVESGRISHHRIGLGRGTIRFTELDLSEYMDRIREQDGSTLGIPSNRGRKLSHLKLESSKAHNNAGWIACILRAVVRRRQSSFEWASDVILAKMSCGAVRFGV